jgi:hypothetical protein
VEGSEVKGSRALAVYEQSDGEVTKAFYADLAACGQVGELAVNLFRAQKCSTRAKVYRGGIRGQGSYRSMAYDRKNWSMQNLAKVLGTHGAGLNITFGWREDQNQDYHSWVLYVDLPTGQVSFHSATRGNGPDYPGDWDGQHASAERIIAFCDQVLLNSQILRTSGPGTDSPIDLTGAPQ